MKTLAHRRSAAAARFAARTRGAPPVAAGRAPTPANSPDGLTPREQAGVACLARAASVEEVLDLLGSWLLSYGECRFLVALATELVERHGDQTHRHELNRMLDEAGCRPDVREVLN
jgi:hypothetical protein